MSQLELKLTTEESQLNPCLLLSQKLLQSFLLRRLSPNLDVRSTQEVLPRHLSSPPLLLDLVELSLPHFENLLGSLCILLLKHQYCLLLVVPPRHQDISPNSANLRLQRFLLVLFQSNSLSLQSHLDMPMSIRPYIPRILSKRDIGE